MAVPAFDHGFLPVGPQAGNLPIPGQPSDVNALTYHGHQCSLADIRDALVVPFAMESTTRSWLFENMAALAQNIERIAPCSLYLVSGSFVTELTDPVDLHLVVILAATTMSAMPSLDQWLVKALMANRAFESVDETHRLTSEYAVAFAPGHPEWDRSLSIISSIRNTAGYPTDEDREAGYLQFTLCEGGEHESEIVDLLAPAA